MGCGIQRGKRYENQDTNQKVVEHNIEDLCLKRKVLYTSLIHERQQINVRKISKAPILCLRSNALFKSRLDRIPKISYANNNNNQ